MTRISKELLPSFLASVKNKFWLIVTVVACVVVQPLRAQPLQPKNNRLHSPTKAVVMSAVLPGLGQGYNRQYWKIPVIYAGLAVPTYFAVVNKQKSDLFKTEYRLRANGILEGRNPQYERYSDDGVLALQKAYQKNFELSVMIGALFYLLNIADALVYAHLFDFDISDNLSMKIAPETNLPLGLSDIVPIGINISINLK